MKKNIISIIFLILFTGTIVSETLNITFPRSGNHLYRNSAVRITWDGSRCETQDFKINIFKNSIIQANFVVQLTATDKNWVQWTIPADYNLGNYQLRVKTVDNQCLGDSGVFIIEEAPTIDQTVDVAGSGDDNNLPLPPVNQKLLDAIKVTKRLNINLRGNIKIFYPNKSTNWRLKLGDTAIPFPIRVQWEKSALGKHENRVKIFLKRRINDRYMRKNIVLDTSAPNSGLFTGYISRNLITSLYAVTIETLGGKLLAESELFHITNAKNDSK